MQRHHKIIQYKVLIVTIYYYNSLLLQFIIVTIYYYNLLLQIIKKCPP